jgi:hypothetical protein
MLHLKKGYKFIAKVYRFQIILKFYTKIIEKCHYFDSCMISVILNNIKRQKYINTFFYFVIFEISYM